MVNFLVSHKILNYVNNMHLKVVVNSREEMIGFACSLGEIFKVHARPKPWMLTLGADADSGKSLIALGIDQAFNPARYTEGIQSGHSADKLTTGSVIFQNFRRPIVASKEEFDSFLTRFEQSNKTGLVLIATNIERTFTGDFDYEHEGLNSDRLDMNIHVHKTAGAFARRLSVTTHNEAVHQVLRRSFG